MKEFPFDMTAMIGRGLRRDAAARGREPALVELLNMKPQPWGLEAIERPSMPIEDCPPVAWPFPQLFRGREVTLLADLNAIYQVDESNWSLTEIETYDPAWPTDTKAIQAGGAWHFMDLGPAWMLFNGRCVAYKLNDAGMFGDAQKAFVQDHITIDTGCEFNGRAVFGGLQPDGFWTQEWQDFWESKTEKLTPTVNRSMPMGSNFVLWSSIGGGDLLYWLNLDMAIRGVFAGNSHYSSAWPMIWDTLRRNEWGFMAMEWQGHVLKVMKLGPHVMAYGDGGISALTHNAELGTFGMRTLARVGIAGRGAAGGNEDRHVFLDARGDLWSIDAQLRMERLGYREYLLNVSRSGPLVVFDEAEEDFWIGSGDDSYILTKAGLARANTSATGLARVHGELMGASADNGQGDGFALTSEAVDMGIRDGKQLQTVEVGSAGIEGMEASALWSNGGEYRRGPWRRTTASGFATLSTAGTDLRLALRGDAPGDGASIHGASIRWKLLGKRTVRGQYAIQDGA